MSLTSWVPAVVPSDFQSSRPFVASFAEKNSVPPTLVRATGLLPAAPLLMSFTSIVPAVVLSDFHRSVPFAPSVAWNNPVPPTFASWEARLPSAPLLMSFTWAASKVAALAVSAPAASPTAAVAARPPERVAVRSPGRRGRAGAGGIDVAGGVLGADLEAVLALLYLDGVRRGAGRKRLVVERALERRAGLGGGELEGRGLLLGLVLGVLCDLGVGRGGVPGLLAARPGLLAAARRRLDDLEGLPQLIAARAVVGAEEQGAVDVGEIAGIAAGRAALDVLDERRASGRAVGLPQLISGRAVVGAEEQRAVDVGEG